MSRFLEYSQFVLEGGPKQVPTNPRPLSLRWALVDGKWAKVEQDGDQLRAAGLGTGEGRGLVEGTSKPLFRATESHESNKTGEREEGEEVGEGVKDLSEKIMNVAMDPASTTSSTHSAVWATPPLTSTSCSATTLSPPTSSPSSPTSKDIQLREGVSTKNVVRDLTLMAGGGEDGGDNDDRLKEAEIFGEWTGGGRIRVPTADWPRRYSKEDLDAKKSGTELEVERGGCETVPSQGELCDGDGSLSNTVKGHSSRSLQEGPGMHGAGESGEMDQPKSMPQQSMGLLPSSHRRECNQSSGDVTNSLFRGITILHRSASTGSNIAGPQHLRSGSDLSNTMDAPTLQRSLTTTVETRDNECQWNGSEIDEDEKVNDILRVELPDTPDCRGVIAVLRLYDHAKKENKRKGVATSKSGWGVSANLEDWEGVYLDGEDRVVALDVEGNPGNRQQQLIGHLPAALGEMDHLEQLTMRNHRFKGRIPPELGNLSLLTHLNLSRTRLIGYIPPELCNLKHLVVLDLSWNFLSGSMPPELGQLSHLEELLLNSNALSGPIPPEMGKLRQLRRFNAGHNIGISGTLPVELSRMVQLAYLDLRNNKIKGPIPQVFRRLTNLLQLWLQDNELTDEIPAELGRLPKLQMLCLTQNKLTGTIPRAVRAHPRYAAFKILPGNIGLGEVLAPSVEEVEAMQRRKPTTTAQRHASTARTQAMANQGEHGSPNTTPPREGRRISFSKNTNSATLTPGRLRFLGARTPATEKDVKRHSEGFVRGKKGGKAKVAGRKSSSPDSPNNADLQTPSGRPSSFSRFTSPGTLLGGWLGTSPSAARSRSLFGISPGPHAQRRDAWSKSMANASPGSLSQNESSKGFSPERQASLSPVGKIFMSKNGGGKQFAGCSNGVSPDSTVSLSTSVSPPVDSREEGI